MSKVLVTGANGFLGSWLCRRLVEEGHEVHVLVRPKSDLTEIKDLPLYKQMGDVTNLDSLRNAVQGCDSVFHLAGLISYTAKDRVLMNMVNVQGTANVISACQGAIPGRLIHLSSVVAIGAGFTPQQILNESSTYNLHELDLGYFETKHQAENLVKTAALEQNLDAVIVNPSTVYGAGDALKGSRKNQIKVAQGKLSYYPPGGVSIVAVEDAIEGIIAAWKKGRIGERYILSGENLLIKDVFNKIAEIAGSKPPTLALPAAVMRALGKLDKALNHLELQGPIPYETALAATLYHWFDNSKAQQELGLKFKSANYALEKSVIWMKENGILKP